MSDSPLTPAASPSDSRIVINCPECFRVMWAGTTCYHGYTKLTPPEEITLREPSIEELERKRKLRGGLST